MNNDDQSTAPDLPAAREAWRMVLVLSSRLGAELDRAAAEAGTLPGAWFDVLAVLASDPARRARLGDLAEAVLLTRAGLSRLLDRIEAAGYLRREPCEHDRRGSYAVLTDAGAEAVRRSWPTLRRTIDERFARHLPAGAAAELIAALRPVLEANGWLPEARPVELTVGGKGRIGAGAAPDG